MRTIFRIIKRLLLLSVMTLTALYLILYVVISYPGVQDKVRSKAEDMLHKQLNVDIAIDRIELSPFDRIELYGVTLPDLDGDTLLYAKKIGAGIKYLDLILHDKIHLSNIQLFGLDVNITRATPTSDTNLQFLIDAFASKEEEEQEPINLGINSALIRKCKASYNVLSEPHLEEGLFDANHIELKDLSTTLSIKALKKDSVDIYIKRFAAKEQSGLEVKQLTMRVKGNPDSVSVNKFSIKLPNSQLTSKTIKAHASSASTLDEWFANAHYTFDIEPSHITLSDIAPIVPQLQQFHSPITLQCRANGYLNDIHLDKLSASLDNNAITFNTSMTLKELLSEHPIAIQCNQLSVKSEPHGAALLGKNMGVNDKHINSLLQDIGATTFNGEINGTLPNININVALESGIGKVHSKLALNGDSTMNNIRCVGTVQCDSTNMGSIAGAESKLGLVTLNTQFNAEVRNGKLRKAGIDGVISQLEYNQYSYNDIKIDANMLHNKYSGYIRLNDPNGNIDINGALQLSGKNAHADVEITCDHVNLAAFNLVPKAEDNLLTFAIDADYTGNNIDNANGHIHIKDLHYGNESESFHIDHININAINNDETQEITIDSEYVQGRLSGDYSVSTLATSMSSMLSRFMPSLSPLVAPKGKSRKAQHPNDINLSLTLHPYLKMSKLLQLPFTLTSTTHINGRISDTMEEALLTLKAPSMWIGLTHIEDADLEILQQGNQLRMLGKTDILDAQLHPTRWNLNSLIKNDSIDFHIDWDAHTQPAYYGSVKLNSQLSRDRDNNLNVALQIQPTQFAINDSVWKIEQSTIDIKDKEITVNGLTVGRPLQHVKIDGRISTNEQDTIHIDLQEVNLDYIFNTLNIDFVTFGGDATGRVDVANLFSSSPHIATRNLDIKQFSYNDTEFGDLSLYSSFDLNTMGILLKGIITNKYNQESYVDGVIYPTRDSLSIAFDVEHVPLNFIRPFLGTILLDINGEASGEVVLEGTFEKIYIYGDAYAHYFEFGVPFINTRYHASDSVHFKKDEIYFNKIKAYDEYGQSVTARGSIKHSYFTQLQYNIDLFDANNVLVFDVPRTTGAMYYGKIFGTGNVNIHGNDYDTFINVNMVPNRNSKFTFALTNTTSAIDYQFLTFSNKEAEKIASQNVHISEIDSFVIQNNLLKERKIIAPTIVNVLHLTITADITPESEITILMNEMTGDKMRGHGSGELRLDFNTADNEILMYGTVAIDNGAYDFSIENLITRKFQIQPGGTVSFKGNPLDALLDITASYSLQANLADLDVSFTTDSELTRTIVPVNTILNISGNLMSPDIGFDIKLPSLSIDMESKMRSLISSDEMMTRQVIYLLVLNRFFASEFSTSGSSYNEFGAMATSTLFSSLSGLMGQFSEYLNIMPNVRSDRGDFSDVEVDLFLSSQLLNNRLIINGNLGYRDSQYSSTNFIGDFDIEYLLTENGNLRLKAYNHFNDRNYTMRTALTTQGIGVMYKHDFNTWSNFFEFSKKGMSFFNSNKEKKTTTPTPAASDSTIIQESDSILTILPNILE